MTASNTTKKIAVFFGGCSTEYEVSLQSACAIISSIDASRYTPILIGISQADGAWYYYRGDIAHIANGSWQSDENCTPVFPSTDRSIHGVCYLENGRLNTISLDAALPVLHGKNGEDGTLQGLLELIGVRIIGCGSLSSALCMDKALAHRIVSMNGIKSARSIVLHRDFSPEETAGYAMGLGYPLFVKPVRSGSSFGISKIRCEAELLPAIQTAFEHDSTVILEEMIDGFEVGCAILGTKDLIIGEVDEIELSDGFFDYTEKYQLITSRIHMPARISPGKAEEIKRAARKVYWALECSGFARVDLFLTPEGRILFHEINTIPGCTPHSRFPAMLREAGLSFPEVLDQVIQEVIA